MPIYQTKLPKLTLPNYSNAGFGTVRPGTSQTLYPQKPQSSYYNGSLVAPPPGIGAGQVTADMLDIRKDPITGLTIRSPGTDMNADRAGYRAGAIPVGIPGTASNFTVDNPDPNAARRNANIAAQMLGVGMTNPGASLPGAAPQQPSGPVNANPWFTNPFDAAKQKDQPYWMKGFNYGR